MRVALVVAMADNGVIGKGNALPWRLPDDLRRFKEVTFGKPIVMGRKTYDSIGRALPGRENVVISRQTELKIDGCRVRNSLAEALDEFTHVAEACVIGGAQLYAEALPVASAIYLTRVHAAPDGDTFFPQLDLRQWRETDRREHAADGRHEFSFTFLTLLRVP